MIDYPGFPTPKFIKNDGFKLALYDVGPKDGPVLVLIHGWPELAYSWKTQIGPLSDAGYRVLAYDLRGFGNSDAPQDISHYRIEQLVSDVQAVIEYSGSKDATLIGHDWGGIILWHAARILSSQVCRVTSLCTPHVGRPPADPIEIFRKRHGDEHYFVHFTDRPGEADALFASDPNAFVDSMFRSTLKGAKLTSKHFHVPKNFRSYLDAGKPRLKGSIISEVDKQVYVDAFSHSGFHGGLNLYRNTTANWQFAEGLSNNIPQPTLMISARDDLFLAPSLTDRMHHMVPDLERHVIEDCGHWMMWEQPEQLSKLLINWLGNA